MAVSRYRAADEVPPVPLPQDVGGADPALCRGRRHEPTGAWSEQDLSWAKREGEALGIDAFSDLFPQNAPDRLVSDLRAAIGAANDPPE